MMKSKYRTIAPLFCVAFCLFSPEKIFSTPNYEVYLESWDPNYEATITGLNVGPSGAEPYYSGVTVDIAFAELDTSSSPYFRGLSFSTDLVAAAADVANVVDAVHAGGSTGKVKISFGGQTNTNDNKMYYFQSTPGFPNNAASLATNLAAIFNSGNYPNLDGVDFDIEEQLQVVNGEYPVTHEQFAAYLLTFFQTLRGLIPSPKIISITIPGQAWPATWKTPPVTATYWQLLCQQLFSEGSPSVVDYVNIMEYPLSIIAGNNYTFSQIVQDIHYYILPTTLIAPGIQHPGWGILPSKIQLGLCVASAAPGQTMLPSNMETLAQAVNSPTIPYPNGFGAQLRGVMIWDLSLDAQPNRANPQVYPEPAAYAYSAAICNGFTEHLGLTLVTGEDGITRLIETHPVSKQYQRNLNERAGATVTATRYGVPAYTTPTAFPNTIQP